MFPSISLKKGLVALYANIANIGSGNSLLAINWTNAQLHM